MYDEYEDNDVEEVEKLDPAAESKFVEVLNERAPPARVPARVVKTRSPAPPPVVPARVTVRAARPTPPPRTPPQGRATRAGAVSSRIPGLLSRASKDGTPTVAADVLDLNSTSDDLLSQHPWDDDGGWVDTMGTPDFQRKENKLGSPSKLPAAAGGDEAGERAAPDDFPERPSFARGKHVRRRRRAGTQIDAAGSWEAATGSAG